MARHPEVTAWLEVEHHTRRTRRLAHLAAVILGLGPALLVRGAAHLAFKGVEPHLAAAFEQVALIAPWIAAVFATRWWLQRWQRGAGRARAATIAARHGVAPAEIFAALEAR